MGILHSLRVRISLLLAALTLFAPAVALAGQGFYPVDKTIRSGMLVSLTKNPGVVEQASDQNASSLVGVVGNSQTDFAVQPDQIGVQTDGVVNVLVSTLEGDILVGDQISPSKVLGFGAKNVASGWIVGTAQGSLDAGTKDVVKSTVTDSTGAKREVFIASIPVLVKVTYYGMPQTASADSTTTSNKVQSVADGIAGKRASVIAIILSFVLLIFAFGAAGLMLNATVRNGFKGIARQPLIKGILIRRMVESFALAIGFLLLAITGALVLLRVL